ncbi:hypothetical protein [Stratiformator vulcanicus]|uniref:hypothetical protein n=1 Tax=Stratiformator vulcanicus TaxID=2527980 RepID=UPI00287741AB|nr:hypothetical protein [Stratiformator vulcanicus]
MHDLVLIRIEPRHFTEFHYDIPWTRDLNLLAVLYASGASVSPGLFFGLLLYYCGRCGPGAKWRPLGLCW